MIIRNLKEQFAAQFNWLLTKHQP